MNSSILNKLSLWQAYISWENECEHLIKGITDVNKLLLIVAKQQNLGHPS